MYAQQKCEELDSYAGEEEIRTVLQSTMRGGSKFWDFRTFNPPISKNNWANEYAEIAENSENTLVIRNTYLDVPADWLGQAFIDEAEELKEINPRAYEHEYLGIATGTGGDVFPNVEDLDMEQLFDVQDYDGRTIKKVPMWKTFDTIYNGLDWGFAADPTRFVRLYYDRKRHDIYIFAEYNTVKTRSIDIYNELYNERKLIAPDELVVADTGGGGSFANADFKAFGAFIRGAEKGADSVNYGIKWLQSLRHIYIDKNRCPLTYQEFVGYEYLQDKEGNFISAYPDENNHCLTGDTIVNTFNGDRKISDLVGKEFKVFSYDIKNNQMVIADAKNCRCTIKNAEIIEIEFENGKTLRCTADHPILTKNRGYVKAEDLTADDDIINIYNIISDNGAKTKIKGINKIDKREDVYDLEVPKYHNFAVNGGIIVHNSIDAVRYALERYYKRKGN